MNFGEMVTFFEIMGELNHTVDSGLPYKEVYDDGILEYLKKLCNKHNIDFDEKEIDWEWCNYIQEKEHEIEEIYREECNILNAMTNEEKFKYVCRINKINQIDLANAIIDKINNSDLLQEIKEEYVTTYTYQDEEYDTYDRPMLYLDSNMLYTFDDWAKDHMEEYDISYKECQCLDWESTVIGDEFNEEQKEFIKLALKWNVDAIYL